MFKLRSLVCFQLSPVLAANSLPNLSDPVYPEIVFFALTHFTPMRSLLFLLILLLSFQLSAQDKLEKEYRVKADEVPTTAVQWLRTAFPKTRKLKWYYEETSGKKSYEAKFCYKHSKFSVEFSTEGMLEDVEIERKWKKLAHAVQTTLQSGFDKIPDFKLHRVQEQWTGNAKAIQQHLHTPNPSAIIIRYEVEFLGVLNEERAFWEGVFSKNGELLHFRKIILSNADNLNF